MVVVLHHCGLLYKAQSLYSLQKLILVGSSHKHVLKQNMSWSFKTGIQCGNHRSVPGPLTVIVTCASSKLVPWWRHSNCFPSKFEQRFCRWIPSDFHCCHCITQMCCHLLAWELQLQKKWASQKGNLVGVLQWEDYIFQPIPCDDINCLEGSRCAKYDHHLQALVASSQAPPVQGLLLCKLQDPCYLPRKID